MTTQEETATPLPPRAEPPSDMDTFIKGLWRDNPVFVQVLGMCPVLAVTNTVINSVVMGLATTFVLLMSSIFVSLFRKVIPKQVRIASFILIIATFVTMADYVIQAVSLEVHQSLGAFISLIVVNCLILGRAEAFSSKNTVGKSMLDAVGMGVGFTFSLLCLGVLPNTSRTTPRHNSENVNPMPIPTASSTDLPTVFFDENASARPRIRQLTTISEMKAPRL